MDYNKIIPSVDFVKQLKPLIKKYRSLDGELRIFYDDLLNNPAQGDPLGNNIYKVRLSIASKGKGKSGGARIVTFLYKEKATIYLIAIYDKSEISSVTNAYLKSVIKSLGE